MTTVSNTPITVTAWRVGDHSVPPKFQLYLDGVSVGEIDVGAYSATQYTLSANIDPAAAHRLEVRYVNDAPGRDLFVGQIQFGAHTVKSTDLGVTYDKGAIDGRDVVAGQEGMWWNGALIFNMPPNASVIPPAPAPVMDNPVEIVVKASGVTSDGQPPRFKLMVDGKLVGEANVSSASSTEYRFTADIPGGMGHKVQIQYMNDGPGRDFFVQGIAIDGNSIASTASNVTYDKGALDGRDVAKGQEAMWWNGTMVFDAPASLFPETVDIEVIARRTGSNPTPPHFTLMLDGKVIGEANVSSATNSSYVFRAQIRPEDAHRVQVQYDNDASGRDLLVKGIVFDGREMLSTAPTVIYDKGALDGRDVAAGQEGMWWNGTLVFSVPGESSSTPLPPSPPPPPAPLPSQPPAENTPTPVDNSYELIVNAWRTGSSAQAPQFKLLVDDQLIADVKVTATSATSYSFKISGDPDEAHKIQIVYYNDDSTRDLFVKGISIDGQAIASTSKYASYDKGAVDGKYVVAGQEALYWGGALTFGVPEEFFNGPVVIAPPDETVPLPETKAVGITLNLSGTDFNGVPAHFKLLVDGQIVGEGVASADVRAHSFTAMIDPSEAHRIQVQYDNDASGNGQDRNLLVESIVVNGTVIAPTASGVTLDRGALDGIDVVAGQKILTGNGTLSFDAPADLFAAPGPAAETPAAPAFYVAANGNDRWSGKLAAPNADGTDGPFATLERARDAMRTSDIDTTYVREGTYHRTGTLELTALDNGVTFKAYPGEKVVLSGGEVVTGFTHEGNGVYSAKLTAATDYDLTIGGVRQRLAEKGAWDADDVTSGWFFAEAAADGPSSSSLRYRGTDITASDIMPGTRIQVFDVERLQDGIVEVQGIDTATRTITFKSSAGVQLGNGSTFRLLDNPNHVDQAGEFAWRESDGRLVFKPADPATLQQDGVEVARLSTLIRLTGTSDVTIDGFTFTNTKATGEALVLTNASGNQISNNGFVNVGTAIGLRGSSDNFLYGNDLEHLAQHGIELSGGSNGNRITANDISHIGEIFKHVSGIMANGVSNNIISHNDITDSARYGISLKNWNDTNINWNNVIEYNRVTNTVRETADAGGIELLGRSSVDTGTIIRGNWVEGAQGLATNAGYSWLVGHKGFGVYLDDLSGGVTVTQNFIKDTSFASVHVHGGDNNLVTGNFAILADNQEDFIRIGWQPVHGENGTPWNNTVIKNLVYGALPLDDYTELLSANNPVIDGNLVYNAPAYGAGDVIARPLFANRLAGDYSLQDGSPAFALGINDLSWDLMGNSLYGHLVQSPDTYF
ncbi:carbohydrate-binding domain-containing protein [Azospirillum sp. SYSU D00513]|uniref:carbohydrate-binding domain-containing protein n=1 Tax=Azospirillum sp. SYSU D00513 TaxID=2812561 RepID=UPI001A968F52|nr:carbohydrate-binding domain-containing protein [Azospirillum sp. SYSU D00513]